MSPRRLQSYIHTIIVQNNNNKKNPLIHLQETLHSYNVGFMTISQSPYLRIFNQSSGSANRSYGIVIASHSGKNVLGGWVLAPKYVQASKQEGKQASKQPIGKNGVEVQRSWSKLFVFEGPPSQPLKKNSSVQFSSGQDGIYAPGKAHPSGV